MNPSELLWAQKPASVHPVRPVHIGEQQTSQTQRGRRHDFNYGLQSPNCTASTPESRCKWNREREGRQEALQVKLCVCCVQSGGGRKGRLVVVGTAAGHAATTTHDLPLPNFQRPTYTTPPPPGHLYMKEVTDGDAITERTLALQRGVLEKGPLDGF